MATGLRLLMPITRQSGLQLLSEGDHQAASQEPLQLRDWSLNAEMGMQRPIGRSCIQPVLGISFKIPNAVTRQEW